MSELRDTRWNLRIAGHSDSLVRRAASEREETLTEFVVGSAVNEAEHVLADRTRFALDDPAWEEFVELLERPVRENPGLAKLFARPSVFE